MTTALHQWANELVRVTLTSQVPAEVEGTLLTFDDAGILLEQSTGKVFVPLAAIVHIHRCDACETEYAELGHLTHHFPPCISGERS